MKIYKRLMSTYSLVKEETKYNVCKITSPDDAYEIIKQFYKNDIDVFETFHVVFLNNAMNTVGYIRMSSGLISQTTIEIKLIIKYAIDTLATGIVIAHNHPSGSIKPSKTDIKMTAQVKEACKVFDITLVDSIILTSSGFYSFANEGEL